jgi:hypothetical protein
MRSSAVTSHRASSSAAATRASAALAPGSRAAANDEPRVDQQRAKEPPGPLWVIAIGMAVFFGAAAFLMMFD